ncbi:response regulator transcription factor [Prolixibacteraceae bacterium Z1-6]|uniref:Response regulator transcription factor n=1 Tax=Draconibacterium aestuarii TaxID=2998507 RepID=A0A9X3F8B7_9BACT|nr:response regulator transcription factor [Prolixibacteraceae bacterium Z1-6]
MCKLAILENYALFYSGIKPVLEKVDGFEIVAEAKTVIDLLPQLKENKPDVIIIDVLHCEKEGIIPIKKIKRRYAKIPILLIVNKDYINHFEDYISLGVNGLVFNNSTTTELITALKKLKNNEDFFPQKVWLLMKNLFRTRSKEVRTDVSSNNTLTHREISVLKLFCKGYTYKEIGSTLNISPRTVETHKKNIASKLGVRSTAEMVEYAIQNQIN